MFSKRSTNMLIKKNVVIFDFDGTLSASDSNYEFFKYCFKHSIRPWLYLPIVIAAFIGSRLNRDGIWWRETIRCFLTPKMINDFTDDFVKQHRRNRFGWAADMVDKERSVGNKVILISASPDYLIKKLVSDIKFDAIITSKMNAEKPYKYEYLCWRKNKVIAMDNWAREHKYIPNVIRSYSDSKFDMPIMEIAKEMVWIDPKTGMRKESF